MQEIDSIKVRCLNELFMPVVRTARLGSDELLTYTYLI